MSDSPKLVIPNWYGFAHDQVAKKFEGNPQYILDFCVYGEYEPVAVYYVEKPNLEKGHKNYLLLKTIDMDTEDGDIAQGLMIRGMTPEEIEPFRYQSAIQCLQCDSVIYSVMRHDMRSCLCGAVAIDGGNEYIRVVGDVHNVKNLKLDMLTREFKDYK